MEISKADKIHEEQIEKCIHEKKIDKCVHGLQLCTGPVWYHLMKCKDKTCSSNLCINCGTYMHGYNNHCIPCAIIKSCKCELLGCTIQT